MFLPQTSLLELRPYDSSSFILIRFFPNTGFYSVGGRERKKIRERREDIKQMSQNIKHAIKKRERKQKEKGKVVVLRRKRASFTIFLNWSSLGHNPIKVHCKARDPVVNQAERECSGFESRLYLSF